MSFLQKLFDLEERVTDAVNSVLDGHHRPKKDDHIQQDHYWCGWCESWHDQDFQHSN